MPETRYTPYRRFSTIPAAKHLVTSHRLPNLVAAINASIGAEGRLPYGQVIPDNPAGQCRLFHVGRCQKATQNRVNMGICSASDVAKFLLRLTENRLPYPSNPPKGAVKGWWIGETEVDGVKTVVATAAWVPEPAIA